MQHNDSPIRGSKLQQPTESSLDQTEGGVPSTIGNTTSLNDESKMVVTTNTGMI